MWELFTLGETPYPGLDVDEVLIDKLCKGYRMNKPINCSENLFIDVISRCWDAIPSKRPDFSQLTEILSSYLESRVRQYYIDLNEEYVRMNSQMLSE